MIKHDLKVGQMVYVKPVGNRARGIDDIMNHIKETEIVKIGTKYFYLKGFRDMKFSIDTMTDSLDYGYCRSYVVYTNMQQIIDEKEYYKLLGDIRKLFVEYGKPNLTLQQLRDIKDIVNGEG
jgi:hypothetical protein